jgi:hypothetical protein
MPRRHDKSLDEFGCISGRCTARGADESRFWHTAADVSVGAEGGRSGRGPNISSCSFSCKMVVARSRVVPVQSVSDNAIAVSSKESVSWRPNDFVPAGIIVKRKLLVMGHVETMEL